ncbi:MAG: hypothetical protein DMG57_09655 [Acidobacteria bacterium]|nr:MAG: hypothetical protein DMG57_09655 [Acidobacteriota bacterium]
MIVEIEEIDPELHLQLFTDGRILDQRQVEILVSRAREGIASQVPEVLHAAHAATCLRIPGAGHGKSRRVQEGGGQMASRKRISHDIRPAKVLVAAVEIAFK